MIDFYPYEPFFDNNEIQTKYGSIISKGQKQTEETI